MQNLSKGSLLRRGLHEVSNEGKVSAQGPRALTQSYLKILKEALRMRELERQVYLVLTQ
jgi:hypothetical protein